MHERRSLSLARQHQRHTDQKAASSSGTCSEIAHGAASMWNQKNAGTNTRRRLTAPNHYRARSICWC